MKLKDKIAIITGGAKEKSIGRAIVLEFAKEGANIVIADILEKSANKTAKEILNLGRRCLVIKTDVSKSGDAEAMISAAINKFGRVDILVNAAGIIRTGNIVDVDEKDWDDVINTNLKGVFLCCKYAGRQMIKQKSGKIINMSSTAGKRRRFPRP